MSVSDSVELTSLPTSSSEATSPSSNIHPLTPSSPLPSDTFTFTTRASPSSSIMNVPAFTGAVNLPILGTKGAPKKFTGKYTQIKAFILHYEKICLQRHVEDDQEKIENITQYCSRSVREFIEGLPSYEGNDWDRFTQDLLEFYDAERDTKRYRTSDIESYCKKSRRSKSKMNMSRWKDYNRGFIRIAGWLSAHNKITDEEQALYFWKGITSAFRSRLESRLLAIQPEHDLETPFEISSIRKVAKSILQRNRFDHDRLPSDDEESDSEQSSDSSDSQSDSDEASSSSSEDETPKKRKSANKSKSKSLSKSSSKASKSPKASPQATPSSKDTPSKKLSSKPSGQDKDVEDLIGQLSRMSLTDPNYAIMYFRAYQLNPIIVDIVRKPISNQPISTSPSTFPRAPPPHVATSAVPAGSGMGDRRSNLPPSERTCFGCGEKGHGMFYCPKLIELAKDGIVVRDPATGKYLLADGTYIHRITPDEPLATAARRMRPAQTNFISIPSAYIEEAVDSDSESEEENTFIATRSSKKTQENRKGFQGVYPPARKKHDLEHPRSKEKASSPPASPKAATSQEIPSTLKQTPINVEQPQFDPNDSDMYIDDDPTSAPAVKPKVPTTVHSTPTPVKRIPRRSDVQAQVDQMGVLSRILSQPVTLAVGEVFGISKDLTHQLQHVLKPKNPNSETHFVDMPTTDGIDGNVIKPIVASSFTTSSRGNLIKLRMECDGNPVSAIIDTGSQLNIAHRRIWKTSLARPVDMHYSVNMNDANGGASVLRGLVPNVPLTCGSVMTHANVYIGDQVPFDLLLGRPWQRGNYVSIDEREDGTYLLFKDAHLNVRHEILVTPEPITKSVQPEVADFINKTHHIHQIVNTITTDEDKEPEEEQVQVLGNRELKAASDSTKHTDLQPRSPKTDDQGSAPKKKSITHWPDYDTDELDLWEPSDEEKQSAENPIKKAKTETEPTDDNMQVDTDVDEPVENPCAGCSSNPHPRKNCRTLTRSHAQVFMCRESEDGGVPEYTHWLDARNIGNKPPELDKRGVPCEHGAPKHQATSPVFPDTDESRINAPPNANQAVSSHSGSTEREAILREKLHDRLRVLAECAIQRQDWILKDPILVDKDETEVGKSRADNIGPSQFENSTEAQKPVIHQGTQTLEQQESSIPNNIELGPGNCQKTSHIDTPKQRRITYDDRGVDTIVGGLEVQNPEASKEPLIDQSLGILRIWGQEIQYQRLPFGTTLDSDSLQTKTSQLGTHTSRLTDVNSKIPPVPPPSPSHPSSSPTSPLPIFVMTDTTIDHPPPLEDPSDSESDNDSSPKHIFVRTRYANNYTPSLEQRCVPRDGSHIPRGRVQLSGEGHFQPSLDNTISFILSRGTLTRQVRGIDGCISQPVFGSLNVRHSGMPGQESTFSGIELVDRNGREVSDAEVTDLERKVLELTHRCEILQEQNENVSSAAKTYEQAFQESHSALLDSRDALREAQRELLEVYSQLESSPQSNLPVSSTSAAQPPGHPTSQTDIDIDNDLDYVDIDWVTPSKVTQERVADQLARPPQSEDVPQVELEMEIDEDDSTTVGTSPIDYSSRPATPYPNEPVTAPTLSTHLEVTTSVSAVPQTVHEGTFTFRRNVLRTPGRHPTPPLFITGSPQAVFHVSTPEIVPNDLEEGEITSGYGLRPGKSGSVVLQMGAPKEDSPTPSLSRNNPVLEELIADLDEIPSRAASPATFEGTQHDVSMSNGTESGSLHPDITSSPSSSVSSSDHLFSTPPPFPEKPETRTPVPTRDEKGKQVDRRGGKPLVVSSSGRPMRESSHPTAIRLGLQDNTVCTILRSLGLSTRSTFFDPIVFTRVTSIRMLTFCVNIGDVLGRKDWSERQRLPRPIDGPRSFLINYARLFSEESEGTLDTNVNLHPFERMLAYQTLEFLSRYLRRHVRTRREEKAICLLKTLTRFRYNDIKMARKVNHRRICGDLGGILQWPPTPPFSHDSVIPNPIL